MNFFWSTNLDWNAGNMEEDCAVAQVMDSDVQGQVEVDDRRMVRGVGTEST
jgi:hypothetical protein